MNKLIIPHLRAKHNTFFTKLWITFMKNYFHLKRVMAKLQHMCLCECDHPLQIKTNQVNLSTKILEAQKN